MVYNLKEKTMNFEKMAVTNCVINDELITSDGKGKVTRISLKKVGRNEKCPCKSGIKFKKCHGK